MAAGPVHKRSRPTSFGGATGERAGPVNGLEPPDPHETWAIDLPNLTGFAWSRLATLLAARDERLVSTPLTRRVSGAPQGEVPGGKQAFGANYLRQVWLENQPPPDMAVESITDPFRVLVLGDPGEGDLSQWAMRRPVESRLHAELSHVAFGVVLSDVIYPAGEASHYRSRFHGWLRNVPVRMFAIPGNHDWDDGTLRAFMTQFCDATPGHEPPAIQKVLDDSRAWHRLWRIDDPTANALGRLVEVREERKERLERMANPLAQPFLSQQQRAPYWSLRIPGPEGSPPLELIAIDTGFGGEPDLDEPQWDWLTQRLDDDDTWKILLTGKPLIDRSLLPMPEQRKRLFELACDTPSLLAVIGGDIHNYQRYTSTSDPPGPEMIVAGGSGAFMAGTIGALDGERLDALADASGSYAPAALLPSGGQSEEYVRENLAAKLRDIGVGIAVSVASSLILLLVASTIVVPAFNAPRLYPDLGLGDDWDVRLAIAGWLLVAVLAGLAAVGALAWLVGRRSRWVGFVAGLVGLAALGLLVCLARWDRSFVSWAADTSIPWWVPPAAVALLLVVGVYRFLRSAAAVALVVLFLVAPIGCAIVVDWLWGAEATSAAFLLLPTVAVALTIAVFLPYGVLSTTLPLPGQGGFSATFGAAALALLLCGVASLAGVPDELFGVGRLVGPLDLVPLLVALGPVLVVVAAYAKRSNYWWLAYVAFAAPLWLAGAFALSDDRDWFAAYGCAVVAALAVAAVTIAIGASAGFSWEGGVPVAVVASAIGFVLTVWFVVWGLDTGLADDVTFGRALLGATVLMSGVHAIALVLIRQLAAPHVVQRPRVVQAVARGEIWAIVEAVEPPLHKSFVEFHVVPGERVKITAFGVSGYEADADHPVPFDEVEFDVSGTPPTQRPAAAPASPA